MAGVIIWLLAFLQLTGLTSIVPTHSLATTAGRHLTTTLDRSNTISYEAVAIPAETQTTPLQLTAAASYAVDTTTSQVLYSHNANAQRPIASITKLMTALVIVRDHSLDQVVTVPTLPAYDPADSRLGLITGQKLTVKALLQAMLIPSADDAADSLAITDAGSDAAFATKMNQVATDWGITGTHFNNPSGLVDTGNYATAQALAQIAGLVLANPTLASITSTPSTTIAATSGQHFTLATTNELLQNKLIQGIKTGYTPAAGQSLVGLASINGHSVVTVILGSQDRFGETTRLINQIKEDYQWQLVPQ